MKEVYFINGEIAEIIAKRFNLICNDNMQIVVSDDEAAAIGAFVDKFYQPAAGDVCFSEI